MSIEEYLEDLVQSQSNIPKKYLNRMKELKNEIRNIILNLDKISKKPTPYDAGSKKKHVMIKESFDLDLLFYYPSDTEENLKDIFNYIKEAIQYNYTYTQTKNVAIRIDFPEEEDLENHDFHIDVVPAKRKTDSDDEAWLYKSKEDTYLKTSLEKHVKAVQGFQRYGILKLLKLWKVRKNIDCPSIIIEQIAMEALRNEDREKIKRRDALIQIFMYINTVLPNRRKIEDPANPSHNLLDEDILNDSERNELIKSGGKALEENLETVKGWKNVFSQNDMNKNLYYSTGVKQRKGKIHPNAPNTRRFG